GAPARAPAPHPPPAQGGAWAPDQTRLEADRLRRIRLSVPEDNPGPGEGARRPEERELPLGGRGNGGRDRFGDRVRDLLARDPRSRQPASPGRAGQTPR